MKTRSIYAMMAASMITVLGMAVGCSDNVDAEFEPISSADRTLTINGSPRDTTINLTAGAANPTITVRSNTRWTVKVIDGGGWCTTDALAGRGDESFTISVLQNMGDERSCTVEVAAVDAEGQQDNNQSLTKSIRIIQEKSNVRITPSSLEAFPATESNQTFEIIANAAWTLDVTYENSNTAHFITVNPGDNMTPTGDNSFKGSNNAKFSISLANNGSDASRLGYLNLKSEIGNYTVEIRQNKSEYTFDVSAEKRTVEPQGGAITFGVLSHSAWTVSCSDTSVRFSPASGQGSGLQETTVATFGPNLTPVERIFRIRFQPEKQNYIPQEIIVTQQPFDLTFAVSPNNLTNVVGEDGGDYTVNVSSMFNWEVARTADWIAVSPNSGSQSKNAATLSVRIDRNATNMQREDIIKVIPLPTEFYAGVTIDPSDLGITPINIAVTQFGGQKPAISVPWLSDGITQKEAVLTFNYYSPFEEIIGAGLEWKADGASEWISVPVSVSDPKSGTVTVTLTGLNPVTDYIARGYVIASDGIKYPGTATYPFKTAGIYPGAGDNPTPTK